MRFRKVCVRAVALAVAVSLMALIAAGCAAPTTTNNSTSSKPTTTGAAPSSALKIALLLPETKTARYETHDRPLFEARVKELAPNAQILYSNANQDPSAQQSQAEAAITNGAKVLVLDPVDSKAAAAIVTKANAANVPVVSYDRLILNSKVDYYVSFDNVRVGKLQATALLDRLKSQGNLGKTIVMINGSPTDNNAGQFKQGAHSVLDGKVKIGAEFDTPDWSPDQAQTEMDQAITKLGKNGFVGVYAANDGTAGGAIAAMIAAGIDPSTKPTTGQDAELAAIQRILLGKQYMTVYKAIKPEASAAAELAVALAQGKPAPTDLTLTKVNNGMVAVPSVLFPPVAVMKGNVKDTVVKDGYWTPQQIITSPQLKAAANSVGIQ
jgi:D-xylose transport system substrate-binding protein